MLWKFAFDCSLLLYYLRSSALVAMNATRVFNYSGGPFSLEARARMEIGDASTC